MGCRVSGSVLSEGSRLLTEWVRVGESSRVLMRSDVGCVSSAPSSTSTAGVCDTAQLCATLPSSARHCPAVCEERTQVQRMHDVVESTVGHPYMPIQNSQVGSHRDDHHPLQFA
jgi:hypothetical protein